MRHSGAATCVHTKAAADPAVPAVPAVACRGCSQISESKGQLALQWITQLTNGAAIRRPPEVYPESGALATVPRLDGRGGSAAAQVCIISHQWSLGALCVAQWCRFCAVLCCAVLCCAVPCRAAERKEGSCLRCSTLHAC
jgi:hypothetical protein